MPLYFYTVEYVADYNGEMLFKLHFSEPEGHKARRSTNLRGIEEAGCPLTTDVGENNWHCLMKLPIPNFLLEYTWLKVV